MHLPNTAVLREQHYATTMFLKLDLNAEWHEPEIAPQSRYITTFSTPIRLRRYIRLIFGISSAAEVFQHTTPNVLHGIPGARNIIDDIQVYRTIPKQHDCSLESAFEQLHKSNLTVEK